MAKILLIEDNEMNRDMLSRRLRRKGYAVLEAQNGEKGMALTAAEQPDLILLDMSLPVMDGWQVARQLKANEVTQHIPIIAQTAHAMTNDREKCLAAGCDDYTTKPINIGQLLAKIERLLLGRQQTLSGEKGT